jgi:NAD(P)-dependent dehydrogenase (short-subunit alcohol dehydrogenase family)
MSALGMDSQGFVRSAFEFKDNFDRTGTYNNPTRVLAGAHAKHNIRVNAICADRINTERVRAAYGMPGAAGQHPRHFDVDQTAERYPFWVGEPQDIADIAVFLACAVRE